MDNTNKSILFVDKDSLVNYSCREKKNIADSYMGMAMKSDGIGYLSIYGGLGNSAFDWCLSDYSSITAEVEKLCNDEKVKCIVLSIDSPGGMATGLFDACDFIKDACKKKDIVAFVDGMACSAAYAIASACKKIYMKKGTSTGCCGCYAEALEMSEEGYKEKGFLHKIFRSANAPKKNLSVITDEETSKAFQEEINQHGEAYLKLVAENRGIDPEIASKTFGRGAVVSAEYALENGMVDGICTFEECVNNLIDSLSLGSKEEENNMTLSEQFNALSDEEKKAFLSDMISANASLVAERDKEIREKELARVNSLEELRDGSESVNAIVDAAVADGKTAEAIGLEVAKAMKANAKNFDEEVEAKAKANEKAKEQLFTMLASSTQIVNPPNAVSEEDFLNEIVNNIQEDRK